MYSEKLNYITIPNTFNSPKIKVLLADDDVFCLEVMERMLKKCQYEGFKILNYYR